MKKSEAKRYIIRGKEIFGEHYASQRRIFTWILFDCLFRTAQWTQYV
jgi:hypothetical protein